MNSTRIIQRFRSSSIALRFSQEKSKNQNLFHKPSFSSSLPQGRGMGWASLRIALGARRWPQRFLVAQASLRLLLLVEMAIDSHGIKGINRESLGIIGNFLVNNRESMGFMGTIISLRNVSYHYSNETKLPQALRVSEARRLVTYDHHVARACSGGQAYYLDAGLDFALRNGGRYADLLSISVVRFGEVATIQQVKVETLATKSDQTVFFHPSKTVGESVEVQL